MRIAHSFLTLFLCFVLALSTSAQQLSAPSPQAPAFLQSALAAFGIATPVSDVTLTGTARRIAGSDDETGTVTMKAISGAGRLDLSFPSGTRSEVQDATGGTPVGTWTGPDGVSHAIAYHNLMTEPAWFFPSFAVARGLSNSSYLVAYVGPETRNSVSVQHLSIAQQPADSSDASALFQHLSQIDLFLDASTFLPAAMTFNIHPDDNDLLDIPVEIQFSDYRAVNGVQVPFHVQKFLNNGLILDLQFQSVVLNSGLSPATFTVDAGLQPGSGGI